MSPPTRLSVSGATLARWETPMMNTPGNLVSASLCLALSCVAWSCTTSVEPWNDTPEQAASDATGASVSDASAPPATRDTATAPAEAPPYAFEGTFDGLRVVLFEGQGCTAGACHGEAAAGGLDLTADDLYTQLVEAASVGSTLPRVEPGDRMQSYLFLKLLAASDPEAAQVSGSPMPSGGEAIPKKLLDALRIWIYAGAPPTGTVEGTAELMGVTLPPAAPITIAPLEAPDPAEGLQVALPPWTLPGGSEREVCFASYFDIRHRVPEAYQDEAGEVAFIGAEKLRQDPQSHHLSLNMSQIPVEDIHDPAFGDWTCKGGATAGAACEPTDLNACGEGHCAATPQDGFACIGYGPLVEGTPEPLNPIGVAQKAQNYQVLPEGVYRPIPLRGIAYWNSHAFNLSPEDHEMNGRLNLYFAEEAKHRVQDLRNLVSDAIFLPSAPPFERQEVCATVTLPIGAQLFTLSSHTHQRGERFTVHHPDGTLLYENTLYNDPLRKEFTPALLFDDTTEEARTLTYCGLYNNGVGPDGAPDPEGVTRHSRMPESVKVPGVPGDCEPIACVAGLIGAPCSGTDDDAACDSAPGANDGWCDACPITGGQSTENEMFVLLGDYYIIEE